MKKLKIVFFIFILCEIISLYFVYYEGYYKGKAYPYNTFLFIPGAAFSDFYALFAFVYPKYKFIDPNFVVQPYLPTLYPLFDVINYLHIKTFALITMICILIGSTFSFLFINLKSLILDFNSYLDITLFCIAITFLSYPILFTIDRGNLEAAVYILVMLYLVLERKKNNFSSIFLGLAISIKIFPAVFLLVSLNMRRYSVIFLTFLSSVFFALIGLLSFKGDGNIYHTILSYIEGLNTYKVVYYDHYNNLEGINFTVSFFTLLRYLNFLGLQLDLIKMRTYYYVLIPILTIFIVFFVHKYKPNFWKVVTISTTVVCLFPVLSGDYKLLYVLLPLPYYLTDTTDNTENYLLFSVLWGLILAPKYLIFHIFPASINFLINIICLITFLTTILVIEMRKKYRITV